MALGKFKTIQKEEFKYIESEQYFVITAQITHDSSVLWYITVKEISI